MRRCFAFAFAVTSTSACNSPFGDRVCAGVGSNAITVSVRDQDGRAIAYGAKVTFIDVKSGYTDIRLEPDDSTTFRGLPDRGGNGATYRVRAEKPYYTPSITENVRTPYVECVTRPIDVKLEARLTLQSGAPPVRTLKVLPGYALLDRPPYSTAVTFFPWFDADPGVSRAVKWTITGDTASVTFDAALGKVSYRCRPTSGYLTLRARSVVDTTVTDTARIAVQGHPASNTDPPCA